jgi:tetratricopeptide (TPR) repeat protein
MAQRLNPDNTIAQINLQFNEQLRAGKGATESLADTFDEPFGKYRTLPAAMNANGPFDVPSFCFEIGVVFVTQNGFMRQAVEPFTRVRQLVPNNLAARLWLAQIYLASRLPDRALDALADPLAKPATFSLNATNSTELNTYAAAAYFQKTNIARASEFLELEISRHPDNNDLLKIAAQAYVANGLFAKALHVIDRKLQLTPDDPTWLFGRGYAYIQMKNYEAAIAAFTRLLAIQTNNPDALFNRAIANLKSDRLDDARADYRQLQLTFTNSFQIDYGLGEIAWRKHETNEIVKNYRLYLATANTNTAEAKEIIQRLQEIQGQPH